MKKLLLFVVVLGAITFTSCSKDECECTIAGVTKTYTDKDKPAGTTGSLKDACNSANALLTSPDKCEMK